MKRLLFLAISFLLLLTACTPNAPLYTEAVKKGLDTKSFESKSTLTLDTNLPVEDESIKALLAALKSGVNIHVQQKSPESGHATFSLQDPSPLLNAGLWPGKNAPAFDIYAEGSKAYFKSTSDNKFLGVTNEIPAETALESGEALKKVFEAFLAQTEFSLKDVKTVGKETVELADGSSHETTHVRISVDFQEAVDFLAFALEYASKQPEFFEALESVPPVPMPGNEANDGSVKDGLAEMAKELKSLDVKQLKAEGWDVTIVCDAWINAEKEFVQDQVGLTVNVPGSVLAESGLSDNSGAPSVFFKLNVKDQMWNINKEVTYPLPPADQIIMLEELEKHPDLVEEFGENSLIGQFVAMTLAPQEPPFVDVPDTHWAFQEISLLKEMGIVNGYGQNEFKPNNPITRSEFVTMAVKALGLEPSAKSLTAKDKNQVPAWAKESWQTAVETGLIKGYNDGTIRPNQKISRAEMVTILVRGLQMPMENGYKLTYADTREIPNWAIPYVKTATANGLVKGSPDNRFAPHKNASRAEVATVLFNSMFGALPIE
ncbi:MULTISPECIES: S-layer homology domain-containing protein [Brevibacillus]|jgi:hypothetical protein|uniref:S-layer homology domain-containing protein n=1 Tax=Brevibacillus TaxID=55080 RepID=UPI0004189568|nr:MULTISPECIES: S-layer homology domain-containing protein [Brevibacillus]UYZ13133.1 S-layer homology domain-containing protein [Brevibacillus sp. WF146]